MEPKFVIVNAGEPELPPESEPEVPETEKFNESVLSHGGDPHEPSPEFISLVAQRVVEKLSDRVIREIAQTAVPRIAEKLIREALEEDSKA